MQKQEGNELCWAASAASIARFYDKFSSWTQCSLAQKFNPGRQCCPMARNGPCDREFLLDKALQLTGNWQDMGTILPGLRFDDIYEHLQARRIIGVRISFSGVSSHFVIIHGCSDESGVQRVDVGDSLYPSANMTLGALTNQYQGTGRWVESIIAKPGMVLAMDGIKRTHLKVVRKSTAKRFLADINKNQMPPNTRIAEQPVYLMDFENTKAGFTTKQVAVRKILHVGNSIKEMQDLSLSNRPTEETSIIVDKTFLKLYERITKTIDKDKYVLPPQFEIRLLLYPEMNTQAVWVHATNNQNNADLLYMLTTKLGFEQGQRVALDSFFEMVAAKLKISR